jgi:hypothetical protein
MEREAPALSNSAFPDRIDFQAPAALRKWPSLQNQRRLDGFSPYLLLESTLEECLRVLMNKPVGTLRLYEIHTAPQPPLVEGVLSGEHVAELARLRDFL